MPYGMCANHCVAMLECLASKLFGSDACNGSGSSRRGHCGTGMLIVWATKSTANLHILLEPLRA